MNLRCGYGAAQRAWSSVGSFSTSTRWWGLRRTAFLCSVVGAIDVRLASCGLAEDGRFDLPIPESALDGKGI